MTSIMRPTGCAVRQNSNAGMLVRKLSIACGFTDNLLREHHTKFLRRMIKARWQHLALDVGRDSFDPATLVAYSPTLRRVIHKLRKRVDNGKLKIKDVTLDYIKAAIERDAVRHSRATRPEHASSLSVAAPSNVAPAIVASTMETVVPSPVASAVTGKRKRAGEDRGDDHSSKRRAVGGESLLEHAWASVVSAVGARTGAGVTPSVSASSIPAQDLATVSAATAFEDTAHASTNKSFRFVAASPVWPSRLVQPTVMLATNEDLTAMDHAISSFKEYYMEYFMAKTLRVRVN